MELATQNDKSCKICFRQLLTSYHVLGTIPRINFVRDDSRAHYLEVESLLSKADFGADFVPTQPDTSIQEYFTLRGKLDSTARVTNLFLLSVKTVWTLSSERRAMATLR